MHWCLASLYRSENAVNDQVHRFPEIHEKCMYIFNDGVQGSGQPGSLQIQNILPGKGF